MPTSEEAMDIFVNSIRENVSDIRRQDIDGGEYIFRASKSHWIDNKTRLIDRWRKYQLPQIQILDVGGRDVLEGVEGDKMHQSMYQVDVYATGWNQKQELTAEVKSIMDKLSRRSTRASGLKLDSIVQDYDGMTDEVIDQDIFRRIITFRTIYYTSGTQRNF